MPSPDTLELLLREACLQDHPGSSTLGSNDLRPLGTLPLLGDYHIRHARLLGYQQATSMSCPSISTSELHSERSCRARWTRRPNAALSEPTEYTTDIGGTSYTRFIVFDGAPRGIDAGYTPQVPRRLRKPSPDRASLFEPWLNT
jgi:hypothetical protein